MKLLYYITSHGYGHAVRTVAICNQLSPSTELIIRTQVPKVFFLEELTRPFTYAPASFDCGCIQSDGVSVDIQKTVETYSAIAKQNETLIDHEILWCKEHGIDCIASDITPFAFDVAYKAGIRSIATTNFTWHTIYHEYVSKYPEFGAVVDTIEKQYKKANVLCAMYPSNSMPYFKQIQPVGVVGRQGTNIRDTLQKMYGFSRDKKIALIYTGNFGMDSMDWHKLAGFTDWEFFGLYPIPGNPKNYHIIQKQKTRYLDLVALADVMISKLGYGICADSFLNALPIIYLPRDNFSEFPVLEAAIKKWEHGYYLSAKDYYELRWEEMLDVVGKREKPLRMENTGAGECARVIENL